jgi:DnaK suppressor protein
MIAMPVEDLKTPEQTIAPVERPRWPNGRREPLKRMLMDLEEEVLGRLRALRTSPVESEPVKDVEEEAFEDVTRDLEVWLVERGFETLKRIDEALARLDEGRYGICERCHSPIPDERLRALPFAALCQDCQSREEEKAPPPSPRL